MMFLNSRPKINVKKVYGWTKFSPCMCIYIGFYLLFFAYNVVKINKRLYLSAGLAERGDNITCLVIQKTHTSK